MPTCFCLVRVYGFAEPHRCFGFRLRNVLVQSTTKHLRAEMSFSTTRNRKGACGAFKSERNAFYPHQTKEHRGVDSVLFGFAQKCFSKGRACQILTRAASWRERLLWRRSHKNLGVYSAEKRGIFQKKCKTYCFFLLYVL